MRHAGIRLWPGRGNRRLTIIGLLATVFVTVTACGGSGTGSTGSSKPTVAIGSKDFTEELLVGQMEAALLEDAGYKVDRKLNLGGTVVAHQALLRGDIDTYVEYTGTGLTAILKLPVQTDKQKVYDVVKADYKSKLKLSWLKPWGFNDTYALVMKKDKADQLGIKSYSDLKSKADQLTLGATQEFLARPDGLPGVEQAYGMKFKASKGLDPGLLYQAVSAGQVDVISGFATDGRIPALNLSVLTDDKHFFPPYFAAPVVRDETLKKDSKIADVLNKLAGKIDDKTMAGLNLEVDQNKKDPAVVAKTFLRKQGLIK